MMIPVLSRNGLISFTRIHSTMHRSGLFSLFLYSVYQTTSTIKGSVMALSSMAATATATKAEPPSVKICVIGGGVGGCAALTSLLSPPTNKENGDDACSNDAIIMPTTALLEMGRSVGGRASTRFSRDDPRIAINHGAPYAEIRTQTGSDIMEKLERKGFAKRVMTSEGSNNDNKNKNNNDVWTGNPNMNSICEGLISGIVPTGTRYVFRSMVQSVVPVITTAAAAAKSSTTATDNVVEGWVIKDKNDDVIAITEWLVVAGSGIAHPRWTTAFGGEPPLITAAKNLNDRKLNDALDVIGSLHSRPVQAALMAFEEKKTTNYPWECVLPEGASFVVLEVGSGEALQTLTKLVIRRDEKNGIISIVAHSNAEFAEKSKDTFGSKSTAAIVGLAGTSSGPEREQEVLNVLVDAVGRVLLEKAASSSSFSNTVVEEDRRRFSLPDPVWGPFLHRWGSAFPEGSSLPLDEAILNDTKIAFCGDYVGEQDRLGTLEGALVSGTMIGKKLRRLINQE